MEHLYLIHSEREASLIGIVQYQEDIYPFTENYCLKTYGDLNGEFWITRCSEDWGNWLPDDDFPMILDWVYDGKHYYEGCTLPDGRVVQ